MAVAGEQPDAVAVALDDQAEPVILSSCSQSRPAGNLVPRVGMQGWNFDSGMPPI